MLEKIVSLLNAVPLLLFYGLIAFVIGLYLKDRFQHQHSILRTHPVIGRLRYMFEMIGPEMRQYWFAGDKENKPIDRDTQETIAKAGKYGSTVIGFGSNKDFAKDDFYLVNSMFPKNIEELEVDQNRTIHTYKYEILNEGLVSRKEKRYATESAPWHLTDRHQVVIGKSCEKPFPVKGLIGVSAMSYGALSKSAVKALAQGVAISGGSFMNTGEGGISPYHLSKVYRVNPDKRPTDEAEKKIYALVERKGTTSNFGIFKRLLQNEHGTHITDAERRKTYEEKGGTLQALLSKMVADGSLYVQETDLIFQIGSGLFGARKDNQYCEETFSKNANKPEVKAIEIKLAQGAKVRGGKLPKEKITPEIAEIRGVAMGKDVESPNRFPLFEDMDGLFRLIARWKELTGKPVGIKVVAGSDVSFEELALKMKETGAGPDFITIDGAQGGTGATYQEMADSLGLPIFAGLTILDDTLRAHGVRDRVTILASGMLATADKMAMALCLGADLIYVARAAMNTIGCLNAKKCHTNHCPVGVTSHLPHLEAGLAVEEKRFRTANYLATMRNGLFMLGASCGVTSPTLLDRSHLTFHRQGSNVRRFDYLDASSNENE